MLRWRWHTRTRMKWIEQWPHTVCLILRSRATKKCQVFRYLLFIVKLCGTKRIEPTLTCLVFFPCHRGQINIRGGQQWTLKRKIHIKIILRWVTVDRTHTTVSGHHISPAVAIPASPRPVTITRTIAKNINYNFDTQIKCWARASRWEWVRFRPRLPIARVCPPAMSSPSSSSHTATFRYLYHR